LLRIRHSAGNATTGTQTATLPMRANAYVQKPVDMYLFMHVIKSIDEFFVSIVRLPSR